MNSFIASCLLAGTGTSGITVENLGIATVGVGTRGGERVLFSVDEAAQGSDLDGDGDQEDHVLHAVPLATGDPVNLGVGGIAPFFSIDPTDSFGLAGFSVFEGGQVDLNGDGDLFDEVAHLLDVQTGVVQNTGVEVGYGFCFNDAFLATWINEALVDINGDGDSADTLLEVHRLGGGPTEILAVSRFDVIGPPALRGPFVWSQTHERYDGDTDLNGDGDALDLLPVFLSVDESREVLPFATGSFSGPSIAPNPAAGERWFVIGVRESNQGDTDLNGDGVVTGEVAHLHEAGSGETVNLGVAMREYARSGRMAGLTLLEADYGGDQNGDGDEADYILQLMNLSTGTITSTGVEAVDLEVFFESWGRFVSFRAPFTGSGSQPGDRLLYTYEISTGTVSASEVVVNVGPTAPGSPPAPQVLGQFVASRVRESSAGQDLNGDGDQADDVLHTVDLKTGETTNQGLAISGNPRLGEGVVVFAIDEEAQGQDVDGDGSVSGFVYAAIDLANGAAVPLELAAEETTSAPALVAYDRTLFARVSEAWVGTDLNGDGDQDDKILHRIVL